LNSQDSQNKEIYFNGFWYEVFSRLRAYYERTLRNPAWLVMSVLGRFNLVRFLARSFAKKADIETFQLKTTTSIFVNIDPERTADVLKQDGLFTNLHLPKETLQNILKFADTNLCYGNHEHHLGFRYPEKEDVERRFQQTILTAEYFNTSLRCQAIRELGQDPKLLEIAARYFHNAQPLFTGSRLWWNFAVDDDQPYDPNLTISFFHYDLDDYTCLRFFFYLTDVGQYDGPHVCVRGSHRYKNLEHLVVPVKRRSDQQIIDYYGSENTVSIQGPAGFGFAEDTFCFHKATRPRLNDRLMLQLQFAIHDYGVHNDVVDPTVLKRFDRH
jgi:hypothetical protein